MRVLVFGASGMIGNAMFRVLAGHPGWEVWGTIRSDSDKQYFHSSIRGSLITGVFAECLDAIVSTFSLIKPNVVVNCIGLTKHQADGDKPLRVIPLNALFPHRLSELSAVAGARLIHISSDCVFSGTRGSYCEDDIPDALDLYGRSKYLGEVSDLQSVTLRTSTIGHELHSCLGLLEWFMAQDGACKGYAKAIFSGLTSVEFARIVRDYVIPHPELQGLYHVGGDPISKYDLLQEVAAVYGKQGDLRPDENLVIDRSLDSTRFRQATGYQPPSWADLIRSMHVDHFG